MKLIQLLILKNKEKSIEAVTEVIGLFNKLLQEHRLFRNKECGKKLCHTLLISQDFVDCNRKKLESPSLCFFFKILV